MKRKITDKEFKKEILPRIDTLIKLQRAIVESGVDKNKKILKVIKSGEWEKLENDITELKRAHYRVHNRINRIRKVVLV